METSTCANSLLMATDVTPYYADSVEWCPFSELSHIFACGTYQLNSPETPSSNNAQTRRGNVALYKLTTTDEGPTLPFGISVEDCVSTSGVLDMKWNPCLVHNKMILAFACSDGKVLLNHIKKEKERIYMSSLTDCNLAENEDKIVVSLDWSIQNENSASIITSDIKGHLNYLQVGEAGLTLNSCWKAHDFECWIAAFNYSDNNVVYSGGDDCCFKAWDLRSLSSPVFVKKSHSMGVTAIAKSKLNENLLVTGSYDENIFLWDLRHMKSPLSDICSGGGVWRLKWHPTDCHYLLSASMHGGFHVLSLDGAALKTELTYTRHKSLAYGVDWSHLTMKSSLYSTLISDLHKCSIKNIIASCSFYDNLLHVWGIKF